MHQISRPWARFYRRALTTSLVVFVVVLFAGNFFDATPSRMPIERFKPQPFHLFQSIERLRSSGASVVLAQSVVGQGDALTLFFKDSNGVDQGSQITCPTGWRVALDGYGPHYIGVLAYDWLQGGSGGTGGGFLQPPSGPPPPTGPPPTTGGGIPEPLPRPVPSGPPEEPPPPPPSPPKNGGPPPGPAVTPGPNPNQTPDEAQKENQKKHPSGFLWPNILNTAFAQNTVTYILRAIGIGSDSVCSATNLTVVSVWQVSQNTPSKSSDLYADACSTHPITGAVTCNRCMVCVK